MSSVVVVAHLARDEVTSLIDQAAAWLSDHGHEWWVAPDDADALPPEKRAGGHPFAHADLVLSLGGDGTMLRSVRMLAGDPVPLLGVNLGRLGYLTEVESDGLADALSRFMAGPEAGEWQLDERLLLDVVATDAAGAPLGTWRALNEAVVEKRESGHTVRLLAKIDGEPFTSYAADGLIVATPTGSTAYSLSARGPIVSPMHRALLLTPVAPHMLFDRTLVLDPSETITIEVVGHREANLAVDGRQVLTLGEGHEVHCSPSVHTAQFVRFGKFHYHQILKGKFGLTDG